MVLCQSCVFTSGLQATDLSSIAGTHTTAASTALLFYNLLHAPDIATKCVAEIDQYLPPLTIDHPAYSYAEVETSLPYLRQAIKESFRITPIFTMPLERYVTTPGGVVIAGEYIPEGVRISSTVQIADQQLILKPRHR